MLTPPPTPHGFGSPSGTPCAVCFEVILLPGQGPPVLSTNCNHDQAYICFACLQHSITAQSQQKAWETIACPHPGCKVVLDFHAIQKFGSTEVFTRYDDYLKGKALEALPEYVQCANRDCKSGGLVD